MDRTLACGAGDRGSNPLEGTIKIMKSLFKSLISIIKVIYNDLLVKKYKDQHFWILFTFIPTFVIARLMVRLDPNIFLQAHGQHVHHFTYGFLILAVTGYLSIVRKDKPPIWLAMLFGIGLALAVDETGMWLHLTDHYYNETSENALIITSAFLVSVVYFRQFWLALVREIVKLLKSL